MRPSPLKASSAACNNYWTGWLTPNWTVACLQALRATDAQFPWAAIERAGYHAVFRGEMRWIGVAILSRTPRVPSRPEPPCPATQPTRSPGTSRRGPRRADRQPVPAPRQSPGRRRSSTIKSNECGTDYATPQADTGSPRSWPATIPCCQPTRYLHHAVLAQERPTEVQTACWPPIYQMA